MGFTRLCDETRALTPLRRAVYGGFLAAAVAVGVFLRVHLLADQVLLDDEWHGFYYVLGKSYPYLLTHFSIPGATCAPLHLYYRALLQTTGWSEILLRLPSLVAGLLGLVLFPLLLRGVLNRRAMVAFCFLLAISPFLIFYSRFSRPYSAEALFGFVAIMSFYRWSITGRRCFAMLYAATGVLTVYFHLFGIVAVVGPPSALLLIRAAGRRLSMVTGHQSVVPSAWRILSVLAVTLAISALLVVPAFVNSARTSLDTVAGAGDPRQLSLWSTLEMLAGTSHYLLAALFALLAGIGLATIVQRNRLLAWMFLSVSAGFVLALAISKPHSMHAAIVVCRYVIPLFPVAFVLVAVGMDRFLSGVEGMASAADRRQATWLSLAMGGIFLAGLMWTGPLRQTYAPENTFTSHAVFQDSYRPIDWRESFRSEMTPPGHVVDTTISQSEVSPFYQQLAATTGEIAVIEFPMLVGDHFNPYYYYQHSHRKRVLIGYSMAYSHPVALGTGCVYGNTYIDEVLSRIPDKRLLRFRNMVNVDETADIQASGAELIVIHRRFEAEFDAVSPPHPCIPELEQRCRKAFGRPVVEDAHVIAFRIGGAHG